MNYTGNIFFTVNLISSVWVATMIQHEQIESNMSLLLMLHPRVDGVQGVHNSHGFCRGPANWHSW